MVNFMKAEETLTLADTKFSKGKKYLNLSTKKILMPKKSSNGQIAYLILHFCFYWRQQQKSWINICLRGCDHSLWNSEWPLAISNKSKSFWSLWLNWFFASPRSALIRFKSLRKSLWIMKAKVTVDIIWGIFLQQITFCSVFHKTFNIRKGLGQFRR